VVPFKSLSTVSYSLSIVTMAVSAANEMVGSICLKLAAAAAAFTSVNSISQRKIKHQYNKMVQLNTAIQIGCFLDLDTLKKNNKIKYKSKSSRKTANT